MSLIPRETRPILTIVTVIKDDIDGFRTTVDSIRGFDRLPIEFIVVDSSKNSEVRDYLKNTNTSNRYFMTPPEGIYPAMNLALMKAKGDWLWFLNSGDKKNPIFELDYLVSDLKSEATADAIAYSVLHTTPNYEPWSISIPIFETISAKTVIHCNHQGFVARRETLNSFSGFDSNFKYSADSKLMDKVANEGVIRIDSRVLALFKIGGVSSQNFRSVLAEIQRHRCMTNPNRFYNVNWLIILKNSARNVLFRSNAWLVKFLLKKILKNRSLY